MSLEDSAQRRKVDRFFGEELTDSNEVFGAANN